MLVGIINITLFVWLILFVVGFWLVCRFVKTKMVRLLLSLDVQKIKRKAITSLLWAVGVVAFLIFLLFWLG